MSVYTYPGPSIYNQVSLETLQNLNVPILDFLNSWSNYDANTQQALALSVQEGRVRIEGRLKRTGSGAGENYAVVPPLFKTDKPLGAPATFVDASYSQVLCSTSVDDSAPSGFFGLNKANTSCFLLDVGMSYRTISPISRALFKSFPDNRVSILVPHNVKPPYKVCLYYHGAGDSYMSHIAGVAGAQSTDRLLFSTLDALLKDGWIVIGSDASTSNLLHWGNPTGANNNVPLVNWVKTSFPYSKLVVLGQSMGGTSAARSLVQNADITKYYGIYPVCNLVNMQANASYGASVNAAYSADGGLTPNLAQCDPISFPTALFAGKKVRVTASYGDLVVPRAQHSDLLLPRVNTSGTMSILAHTGDHGDLTAFVPTDVLTFFNNP